MIREIVVLDDEPEKSVNLVHYLHSQGYTAWFENGGLEALYLIAAKSPDLVICDLEKLGNGTYWSSFSFIDQPSPRTYRLRSC